MIRPGDVLIFVTIGTTQVRADLIEAIDDQYAITLEGTPYQLGDDQDATSVLADIHAKLLQVSRPELRSADALARDFQ